MMDIDLKPCPFCGGKAMAFHAILLDWEENIEVGCTVCDARIHVRRKKMLIESKNICGFTELIPTDVYFEKGAIERWNRRVSDENP